MQAALRLAGCQSDDRGREGPGQLPERWRQPAEVSAIAGEGRLALLAVLGHDNAHQAHFEDSSSPVVATEN